MRQIVLDTETTGIGAETGHRIIEIGCIELVDRVLTGRSFHTYLNPERLVDEGAFRVHGLSDRFLSDKPLFKDILEPLLAFIDQSELIIHNAVFDVGFLNAELKRIQWPKRLDAYCTVLDTLAWAKKKHPGQRNSLDALCKRYDITHFNRDLHGALLDAEILAHLYLKMTGGQTQLFTDERTDLSVGLKTKTPAVKLHSHSPIYRATEAERREHEAFVEVLIRTSGKNRWMPIKEECKSS